MDLNPEIDCSNTRYKLWKQAEQDLHDCIMWEKSKNAAGYGVSWKDGKFIYAHRKAYLEAVGDIPDGMVVMHTCDKPSCVNPKHLVVGTYKQNSQDMVNKNRQAKGNQIGNVALTKEVCKLIASLSGPSRKIAKFFGTNKTTVLEIRRGTHWSCD